MNKFAILALAALAVLARAHPDHPGAETAEHDHAADEPAAPSDVVVLTDDTIDETIAKNPYVMVEFYAPWCGHCKALAPEYEKAATLLKGVAVVAKIDATENQKSSQANGIQGFPTLRLFVNGKSIEYNQARKAEAIATFVKKATEPALVELKTAEEVAKFREEHDIAVVGWFAEKDEKSVAEVFSYAAFKEAAEEGKVTSSAAFAIAPSAADVAAGEGVKAIAKVYRKVDGKEFTYDTAFHHDAAGLLKWTSVVSLLPLDEIGPQNFQKYFDLKMPLLWLLLDPSEDNTAVKATTEKLANDFVGKILCVWLDKVKYGGQAKHIGLSGKSPAVSIVGTEGKFPFEDEITEESLRKHIEGVLDGSAKPHVKSAEVPADNEERNVFEVTGHTFKKVVTEDTEKDVLVEFFAEYCGHCKALAPIYDELGRLLKSVPTVRIARVNVPDNDVPVSIRGFPTVMLFRADKKDEPITYEGDRTIASLLQFVKEHAKTPFEFPEEAAKVIAGQATEAEEEEGEAHEEKQEL